MSKQTNSLPELKRCPVCGEPTEEYFPDDFLSRFPGFKKTHPRNCACMRTSQEAEQARAAAEAHMRKVKELAKRCFGDNSTLYGFTFSNSAIHNNTTDLCSCYVSEWNAMKKENQGLLFWGDVGTGKSYMAVCIANALIEQEVDVQMLNLSTVMNATFEVREEMLRNVRRCQLLIVDHFGMERETDYGMEIAFQVIDARYQSGKPLIVTTNLSLNTFNHPSDLAHRRIYDRITQMCNPVFFEGNSMRQGIRKQKMKRFGVLMRGENGEEELHA